MKSLGQLLIGLLSAAASSLLLLAAVSLSLVEGQIEISQSVSPSLSPEPGTSAPVTLITFTPTLQSASAAETAPPPARPTKTQTPQRTLCPAPPGWEPYLIQTGDDVQEIADRVGISPDQILQGNCMISETLLPGAVLYLPDIDPTLTVPPALPTAVRCGPPRGWTRYTVQPKDNLFRLAQAFGVTVQQLQAANCMSGTTIIAGSRIYVPNVSTRTPDATSTSIPTSTFTPEPTATTAPTEETSPTAAISPTFTSSPTDTPPPSMTPTQTTEPTLTPTITPTATTSVTPAGEDPNIEDRPTPLSGQLFP